jgi:hypothetical protein
MGFSPDDVVGIQQEYFYSGFQTPLVFNVRISHRSILFIHIPATMLPLLKGGFKNIFYPMVQYGNGKS